MEIQQRLVAYCLTITNHLRDPR
ncbi:BH3378 [Halalkalibacterium halodurans C-125]|uniref:BH3378 protein n=1 Tax=Halalkalibacterium halodurans (strain ATCC BAA-125 / DSM 18197 / FERM 7344 / JCM 9153 / C-125) TaxID=272558 RepID=Q9K7I3_HALH5|nr:BH3378 [Halalkalibacterium halodurans C-125]